MRYKQPTKHTLPPTSRAGEKLQLSIAKRAVATGRQPVCLRIVDDAGVVHCATLSGRLYCGKNTEVSFKLVYDMETCIRCVVTPR